MVKKEDWLDLARHLDWDYSYVTEEQVFPVEISGSPWLSHKDWQHWDEPYKTTYNQYVQLQATKEDSVLAVKEVLGKLNDFKQLNALWTNALKLHTATFPLAEFAAVIGNYSKENPTTPKPFIH